MNEQQKKNEKTAQARDTEFWNRLALREREGFRQNEFGEWVYMTPAERKTKADERLRRMKPITERVQ